jgi:hypothetical protein
MLPHLRLESMKIFFFFQIFKECVDYQKTNKTPSSSQEFYGDSHQT